MSETAKQIEASESAGLLGGTAGEDARHQSPRRIQRSRAKGWRMPEGAVYVGRPTKWGNPHKVGVSLVGDGDGTLRYMNAADAAAAYRDEILPFWTDHRVGKRRLDLGELRGKNLACWCPIDQPCHADVLLEFANRSDVA